MPDNSFGVRLRAARHEAGLSQNDLAARSGVPKTRLSRYENGHILPSLPTLSKLSKALDMPESSLLGENTNGAAMLSDALQALGIQIRTTSDARIVALAAKEALDVTPVAAVGTIGSAG